MNAQLTDFTDELTYEAANNDVADKVAPVIEVEHAVQANAVPIV